MKTTLLALLFLAVAMVAVEARPGKCGGPGGGRHAEVFEALAEDNGVLEWFFLEEVGVLVYEVRVPKLRMNPGASYACYG